jgi:hypothetical protein
MAGTPLLREEELVKGDVRRLDDPPSRHNEGEFMNASRDRGI